MTNNLSKYNTGAGRLGAALVDALVFVPIILVDEFMRQALDNQAGMLFWLSCMTALPIFYSVFLHYKYGQTIGKMVLNIKVVSLDETKGISIKQALLRDSFYILAELATLLFFMFKMLTTELLTAEMLIFFDDFGGSLAFFWVILELLTMLTNPKRRAIHDFIAGTVVIKTNVKEVQADTISESGAEEAT